MGDTSKTSPAKPAMSVVVPIVDRCGNLQQLYEKFAAEIRKSGHTFEFIFVLDSRRESLVQALTRLKETSTDPIYIIVLAKSVGESGALSVAFRRARGEIIVTLAPYFQVEPSAIGEALRVLREEREDVVVGRRYPRLGSYLNRLQSALFHWIVRKVTATTFHDITGGFRVMRREVADSLNLYGDLHRFIPIIALNLGFKVRELKLKQHLEDRPKKLYGPAVYLRRILDLLTVFFLVKFTRRPLQFFGMIGLLLGAVGFGITLYLGFHRILGFGGIADRPLLLLGILLMVLGVQSISIGLLGEIVIFTHAREIKEYHVSEVI